MLRGKKCKAKNPYINQSDEIDRSLGKLKYMSENDIRRMILKMMILKVLKEQFLNQKIREMGATKI